MYIQLCVYSSPGGRGEGRGVEWSGGERREGKGKQNTFAPLSANKVRGRAVVERYQPGFISVHK